MDAGNNNVDDTTKNENGVWHNNIVADKRDSANQSHKLLAINNLSLPNATDANSNASQKKKVNF